MPQLPLVVLVSLVAVSIQMRAASAFLTPSALGRLPGVLSRSSSILPTTSRSVWARSLGPARLMHRVPMSMTAAPETPVKQKLGKGKGKDKEESKYSKTVNLPVTDFNQRADSARTEPIVQKFWEDESIYQKIYDENTGGKYVLHDGPPYANGDLHIGHALNKILKDFINRYQMLCGKKVRFVPGWDCHGLPIELKVLQAMKGEEKKDLTPVKLRKKAASFAKETVQKQLESFRRYGVWGDWATPYLTLLPEYEAAQIQVFAEMVKGGHIYRGRKPVNWSPSSRTALAEAELEYPDNHISRSMYASFEIKEPSKALEEHKDNLRVAIWTTTPWTIPANLAVAVNERLEYAIVKAPCGTKYIVAKDLVGSLASKMAAEGEDAPKLEEIAVLKGKDLEGSKYKHPLFDRTSPVVIGGDYITTESGTGLVHTAPGHGTEDYQTGLKYGLELLSPVDDGGFFTEEAGEALKGKNVLSDGNEAVLVMMKEAGALIKEEPYNHKYPYDWRTKKPTIFRATDQWFASVDSFRADAMKAIDGVQWIPDVGKKRIQSMVEGRSDWCISRQRSWGVPIPVFYHKETGAPLLTAESIEHVRKIVAKHGTDAWFEMEEKDLLPPSHQGEADMWTKGRDTMDVWFDSGSSWAGVVKTRADILDYPADMYLEGSDQHRGWFQSSLLTSVAAQGKAPYKTVLTHGFVLDEKGFKMSKSLGNVIDPRIIIEGGKDQKKEPAFGADVLRLWVSSVDYTGDVRVGQNIMKQISDSYRKIRNTLRYLLGNLYDFDPEKDSVKYEDLPELDKWMLGRLTQAQAEMKDAFDNHQFFKASQVINQLCVADLSNLYLDVAKDRLYISSPNQFTRRACQTVLKVVLETLLAAIAPITPHMAEDAWLNVPFKKQTPSVFQAGWKTLSYPEYQVNEWSKLRQLRDDVNLAMEAARLDKLVGASMEAQIVIHTKDAQLKELLTARISSDSLLQGGDSMVNDLRFVFMASQVKLVDTPEEVLAACGKSATKGMAAGETESEAVVGVTKAEGKKCERCWYYDDSVGTHNGHDDVCPRCGNAVAEYYKSNPVT